MTFTQTELNYLISLVNANINEIESTTNYTPIEESNVQYKLEQELLDLVDNK